MLSIFCILFTTLSLSTQSFDGSLHQAGQKEPTTRQTLTAFFHESTQQELNKSRQNSYNKPSPSPEVCCYIILQNPYAVAIYNKVQKAHQIAGTINHPDLPTRILNRIAFYETCLPPPYKQHLIDASAVHAKTIPQDQIDQFKKNSSLDPQIFYAKLNDLFQNATPLCNHVYSDHISILKDIIYHQDQWSYQKLTEIYEKNKHFPAIKELYNYYTQKRFHDPQTLNKIQHDPLFKQASPAQKSNPNFQSELMLRAQKKYALAQALNIKYIEQPEIAKFVYDAINSFNNEEEQIDHIVKESCTDACPETMRKSLFNSSGILQAYRHSSFINDEIAQHQLSPKLQLAFNFALINEQRKINIETEQLCHNIMHNTAMALATQNQKEFDYYEQNAHELYKMLRNKQIPTYEYPEINDQIIEELEQLEFQNNIKQRVAALQQAQQEKYQEYEAIYSIEQEGADYLRAHGVSPAHFTRMTANGFQHEITEELVSIINEFAPKVDTFAKELALFLNLSQTYNLAKKSTLAVVSTDICWGFVRYNEAVALGISDSADGYRNILAHPIIYLQDTASGMAQLALLTFATAQYPIDCIFNPNKAETTAAILNDLQQRIALYFEQSTGPQLVRDATRFITDQIILMQFFSTMNTTLNNIMKHVNKTPALNISEALRTPHVPSVAYTSTGDMTVTYLHSFKNVAPPGKTPKYATLWVQQEVNRISCVAEGLQAVSNQTLIQAFVHNCSKFYHKGIGIIEQAKNCAKSWKNYFTKRAARPIKQTPNITPLKTYIPKVEVLKAAFPEYYNNLKRIHLLKNHQPTFSWNNEVFHIDLEHMMGTKIRSKNGHFFLEGAHYNPKGPINIENLIAYTDIIYNKDNFYSTNISFLGKTPQHKTCYPINWSEEKILQKIFEAWKDIKKWRKTTKGKNKKIAVGYTQENYRLIFIIDTLKQKLITAYPCGEWIIGNVPNKTYEI